MSERRLERYRSRRDFRSTPEPSGEDEDDVGDPDTPMFVIQQHDASSMHFDFRLEIDGALASWAVPKGPSTDPSEKRLALRTEDHPLDYADFEGVIPEDEYGGGTVLLWDRGPYRNLADDVDMAEALEDGKIEVFLDGEKIQGGYVLIRTGSDDDQERWLLIKKDDDHADARRKPVSTEPESVASGRQLKEIAEEGEDDG
jgi:DNA ligase D-like protein (predicted 3'-phosphoesterase)